MRMPSKARPARRSRFIVASVSAVPTNGALSEFDRTLNEGDAMYRQQLSTGNVLRPPP